MFIEVHKCKEKLHGKKHYMGKNIKKFLHGKKQKLITEVHGKKYKKKLETKGYKERITKSCLGKFTNDSPFSHA